jgi:hypothetical protein
VSTETTVALILSNRAPLQKENTPNTQSPIDSQRKKELKQPRVTNTIDSKTSRGKFKGIKTKKIMRMEIMQQAST